MDMSREPYQRRVLLSELLLPCALKARGKVADFISRWQLPHVLKLQGLPAGIAISQSSIYIESEVRSFLPIGQGGPVT